MSKKKVVFKLSPELSDGVSHVIVDNKQGVMEAISLWIDERGQHPGEEASIETVEMADEEIESLPTI